MTKKSTMNLVSYIQKIKNINFPEWKGVPRIFIIIFLGLYIPMWIFTIGIAHSVVEQGFAPRMQLPVFSDDSLEYQTLAWNIINIQSFSLDRGYGKGMELDAFRAPGYPFLVAIIEFVFTTGFVVTLFQIFAVLITACLIRKLGDMVSLGSGVWAGIVYMLMPVTLYHSLIILSDTIFVFLLVMLVYVLLKKHTLSNIIASSIILGVLIYIRPIAQFLIPAIAVYLLYEYAQMKNIRQGIIYIFCIVFIPLTMMLPWLLRNYKQFGAFSFSSVTTYNALVYNISGMFQDPLIYKAAGLPTQYAAFKLENAVIIKKFVAQELKNNFVKYLQYHFSATHSFFGSTGMNLWDITLKNYKKELLFGTTLIKIEKAFLMIVLAVFAIGAVRHKKSRIIIISVGIIVYFWVLTGPVAYARYRMPAEPFILIVATAALFGPKKDIKTKSI